MPSSSWSKFQSWSNDLVEIANLDSDAFVVALTAAANAPVNTNTVLANLTQVSYTNCSTRALSVTTKGQTSGTYTFDCADLTLTASGGSVGPFRYVVVYDDTPTSPADPLVGWLDYGSDITLASGESLLISFAAGGLFTVA